MSDKYKNLRTVNWTFNDYHHSEVEINRDGIFKNEDDDSESDYLAEYERLLEQTHDEEERKQFDSLELMVQETVVAYTNVVREPGELGGRSWLLHIQEVMAGFWYKTQYTGIFEISIKEYGEGKIDVEINDGEIHNLEFNF